MLNIIKSKQDIARASVKDDIHLICQFFIHKDENRHKEILYCLKMNVENKYINKIHLLNERIYTCCELGLNEEEMKKITQININHRMAYNDIFDYIENYNVKGYIVFANSDIFFDDNLKALYTSSLSTEKSLYGLLRFEYDKGIKKLIQCKIFGPRGDSQDTWIYHSKYNVEKKHRNIFSFNFGKLGCDNKIMYLFQILGYKLYNEPYKVKTYHYHTSQIRNYTTEKVIDKPYLIIYPYIPNQNYELSDSEKAYRELTLNYTRYNLIDENKRIYDYVYNKLERNERFIIPRIAGVENNFVFLNEINEFKGNKQMLNTMKNNAGINLTDTTSYTRYCNEYKNAFKECDMYFEWESFGNVYPGIKRSHDWITNKLCKSKGKIWAFALDVFNVINFQPWTLALKGKRILIISAFEESYKKQLNNLKDIYGINLFPECTFIFLKPPQTQGQNNSRDWYDEYTDFCNRIDEVKDQFEIALCSCGGYGNPILSHIKRIGKSAIYVGGVLQMYFGILGERWIRERSEIVSIYMNDKWSRPMDIERPIGFMGVEGSSYW